MLSPICIQTQNKCESTKETHKFSINWYWITPRRLNYGVFWNCMCTLDYKFIL